jgi:hypothetical protein
MGLDKKGLLGDKQMDPLLPVDEILKLFYAASCLFFEISSRCGDNVVEIKSVQSARATPHNYLFHHAKLALRLF